MLAMFYSVSGEEILRQLTLISYRQEYFLLTCETRGELFHIWVWAMNPSTSTNCDLLLESESDANLVR